MKKITCFLILTWILVIGFVTHATNTVPLSNRCESDLVGENVVHISPYTIVYMLRSLATRYPESITEQGLAHEKNPVVLAAIREVIPEISSTADFVRSAKAQVATTWHYVLLSAGLWDLHHQELEDWTSEELVEAGRLLKMRGLSDLAPHSKIEAQEILKEAFYPDSMIENFWPSIYKNFGRIGPFMDSVNSLNDAAWTDDRFKSVFLSLRHETAALSEIQILHGQEKAVRVAFEKVGLQWSDRRNFLKLVALKYRNVDWALVSLKLSSTRDDNRDVAWRKRRLFDAFSVLSENGFKTTAFALNKISREQLLKLRIQFFSGGAIVTESQRLFASLNRARESAGVDQSSSMPRTWQDDDSREALKDMLNAGVEIKMPEKVLKDPRAEQIIRGRNASIKTASALIARLYKRSGSWRKALQDLGFDSVDVRQHIAWDRDEVLKILTSLVRFGESPIQLENMDYGRLMQLGEMLNKYNLNDVNPEMLFRMAQRFFGTWHLALKAAGLTSTDGLNKRKIGKQLLILRRMGVVLRPDHFQENEAVVMRHLGFLSRSIKRISEIVDGLFGWQDINFKLQAYERSDTYLTARVLFNVLQEMTQQKIPINSADLRFDRDGRIQKILDQLGLPVNTRAILTAAEARFGGLDQMAENLGFETQRKRLDYDVLTESDLFEVFKILEEHDVTPNLLGFLNGGEEILKSSPSRIKSYPQYVRTATAIFGGVLNAKIRYAKVFNKRLADLTSQLPITDAIADQIIQEVIKRRLPCYRMAVVADQNHIYSKVIAGVLPNERIEAKQYVTWVLKHRGSWSKFLRQNGYDGVAKNSQIVAREIPLNLAMAKSIMEKAASTWADLSYTGVRFDRYGDFSTVIRAVYPDLPISGGQFASWVTKRFKRWSTWLIENDINPDEITLGGRRAEFHQLKDWMKDERRRNHANFEVFHRETGYRSGADDVVETELIDPSTPESMMINAEIESEFYGAMKGLPEDSQKLLMIVLSFIEDGHDPELFGPEFAEYYEDREGRELNEGLLVSTLKLVSSNQNLRDLFN